MEVRWTDLAVETLSDIVGYVEDCFSVSVAERVGREIVDFVDGLANNPKMGRPVSEWQTFGHIRRIPFKQNVIYYMLQGNSVEIILVWDGRRSPWDMERLLLDYFANLNR